MKKLLTMLLLVTIAGSVWGQMSQNVTIDGTSNEKFVTMMTFDGDNVTMTYEGEGASETTDMGSVAIDFDYAVTLKQGDSEGNTEKLRIYGGRVIDVTVDRTVKNSYWAPVCFPFSMSEAQLKAAYGDGMRVTRLTKATGNTIAFTKVSAVTAGEPYLMKLADGADAVTSFTLTDVALNNFTKGATMTGDSYSFVGTIPAVTLSGDNNYYFTTSNTMRPLIAGNSILAMRGYMVAKDATAEAREMVFIIDNIPTGIVRLNADGMEVEEGDIYDLQGRKFSSANDSFSSLPKGVYIINGKKMVVK